MIPVQNIYYMLAYAFQVLKERGYRNVAAEAFDNAAELCSAILAKGTAIQIKRGLRREYVEETAQLTGPRGKIEVSDTIKTLSHVRKKTVCTYDEFSVNAYCNRIIKTTMELLLRTEISGARKKELKKLLPYFDGVDTLNVRSINWNLQYDRNNRTYQMLVSICYLIVKGMLQTTKDGTTRLMDFLDEKRMSWLYERFVLEYYRQEFPEIAASSTQIPWALDDGNDEMLPNMQSDIMLTYGGQVLIIDTKYYSHTTQSLYGVHKIRSGNLYQIFAYVKNRAWLDPNHTVSGMLLYARTDESIQPEHSYWMSGNRIVVRTLDLNCDFSEIRAQLDVIAETFLETGCQAKNIAD